MDDPALVNASLNGDREAFGQIVGRYQALIASVAYSATGNLAQSEDIAQETFVTAWRQLQSLREPGKLRGWLCGIARRITANALRHEQREPAEGAVSLEHASDTPAMEALPVERAITREEEAILWRALEHIPQTYREPLILFYRENQSIDRVAQSLEISEEAARQRLSRGRKLLEERVSAFVEGTLKQSAPGNSFTLGVLGALPAQTAFLGSASATISAATKVAAWFAALSSFAGLFVGSLTTFLGYRTDMAGAKSELDRIRIRRFYAVIAGCILLSTGLLFALIWVRPLVSTNPTLFATLAIGVGLSWVPGAGYLTIRIWRGITIRNQDRSSLLEVSDPAANRPAYEYRSNVSLLGLPLVHVRLGGPWVLRRKPVTAWIAMGDVAFGGLFAMGGVALAPLAFGGLAVGGVIFGGFAVGLLAYAGFALGIWAMGGIVAGVQAIGGCAIGWKAATGGVAVARDVALGAVALALHANDGFAQEYIGNNFFFRSAFPLLTKWLWPTMILVSLPSIFVWILARRKRQV